MTKWIGRLLPLGSSRRLLFGKIFRYPFSFPMSFLSSLVASYRLTGKFFPLAVVIAPTEKFRLVIHGKANIEMRGVLNIAPWGGSNLPSSLTLGTGSSLVIQGDFHLGPNVHIEVSDQGELIIGGMSNSTGSGVTCDSRIKVESSVRIGTDCIIAWNVFISDSNWHEVDHSIRQLPVVIGCNVWISHGVSVLKGSLVPDGCIVAAHSVVNAGAFSENSLLVGNPARVKREGIVWQR